VFPFRSQNSLLSGKDKKGSANIERPQGGRNSSIKKKKKKQPRGFGEYCEGESRHAGSINGRAERKTSAKLRKVLVRRREEVGWGKRAKKISFDPKGSGGGKSKHLSEEWQHKTEAGTRLRTQHRSSDERCVGEKE